MLLVTVTTVFFLVRLVLLPLVRIYNERFQIHGAFTLTLTLRGTFD